MQIDSMEVHDPLVRLFPQLAEVDMRSSNVMFSIIALSFVSFLAVFVASYFLSFFFVTFRLYLSTKEKVFWCLAFVRALFGFIATGFGTWGLLFTNILHNDVVNATSPSSFMDVYIGVGFFLFECIISFGSDFYFRKFDPYLAAHHSLSLFGSSVVAYYGKAHFFAVVGMMVEFSTPFSCLCWMLLKAKMAKHFLWKANQFVLVHLFHCRTIIEGYFYYKSYMHWENIWSNMPALLMLLLYVQVTAQFFVLTPYWTYKKTLQLVNPVDWNHPELQANARAAGKPVMNGRNGTRPKTQ